MTTKTLKSVMAALAVLLSLRAHAHDVEVDGIYYNLNSTDKTATVTYKGTVYTSAAYSGTVVIPASIVNEGITYRVTSIGTYAFCICKSLTSVSIPNSIVSIAYGAFSNSGLTSVCFSGDQIVESAFFGCKSLTSVDLNCRIIGKEAFYGCSSLNSVTLGLAVQYIFEYAFSHCSKLKSVSVFQEVPINLVWGHEFEGISTDCVLTVPYATSTAYSSAGWTNEVFKGGIVETYKRNINEGGIEWDLDTTNKTATVMGLVNNSIIKNGTLTIPSTITYGGNTYIVKGIGESALSCCDSEGYTNPYLMPATQVIIPNTVTFIGDYAFEDAPLKTITIPNSVTSIGQYAFMGCSGLTSVTLSNNMTSIGESTFEYCKALTSATIPNSVTSIGYHAFAYCI